MCKNNTTYISPPKFFGDPIKINECVYGTPYYITIEERKQIESADLSAHPQLAIQRDIFVFQCCIGCRVGDLYKFTPQNVVDGAIQYVPRKTKEGRPVTVSVPLNATALEILKRYAYSDPTKLLPYISEQKYNDAIKRVFELSGHKEGSRAFARYRDIDNDMKVELVKLLE